MRHGYTTTKKLTRPGVQGNRFPLLFIFLLTFLFSQKTFSQGVGIGTTSPDPSAALHIYSPNKGILIPKVQINNKGDKVNVPNPANTLLVYNLNPGMYAGTGFYFNNGTAASPDWRSISQWYLPYEGIGAEDQLLNFENYSNNTNSATLRVHNVQGYALKTSGKIQIAGSSQSPGVGKVLTSDASGNATWQGAVAFRASGVTPAGSKIKNNTETKISFSNEDYDLSGNYTNVNGTPHNVFIAPKPGIYHFDSNVQVEGEGDFDSFNTYLRLYIVRNGAQSCLATSSATIKEGSPNLNFSLDVKLEANDQIFVTIDGLYDFDSDSEYFKILSSNNGSLVGDNFFNGRLVVSF